MLQTVDPLFPIGSYAHSYGLEELVSLGKVSDAQSLGQYIDDILLPNLQEFELPYLRFLYNAAIDADWEQLIQLDQEIGASKLSKEIRNASSSQGQQRLRILRKLRPCEEFETLQRLKREKRIAPHHLSVNAVENVILGTPIEATLTAWAYQAIAAPCSAALKLMRIGQEGCQLVLTDSLQKIEPCVNQSQKVEQAYAGCFNPLLDIASSRHEQAYSRLFIS